MKAKFQLSIAFFYLTSFAFAQVELIKECGLPYNNGPFYMMTANGKLFFAADETGTGLEPWISDGTPGGTHLLKDIATGTNHGLQSSGVNPLENSRCVAYKNEFYFIANNGTGEAIWKTNSAADTVFILKNIYPNGNVTGQYGSDHPYFCELNGILYFAAANNANGSELWRTDGTDTGTRMVKDIYTGNIGSTPAHLHRLKDAIYFTAWGEGTGIEVWKTKGTEQTTELVKDIRPGGFSCFYSNSSWQDPFFKVSGDYLYFVANADTPLPAVQFHYWRTDGTELGTIQLETNLDVQVNSQTEYADMNGTFVFTASDGVTGHSNLFKSNGTPNGTVNIAVNNELGANGAFMVFNNKVYFNGFDHNGSYRYGLAVTDGTTQGSYLIKGFTPVGSAAEVRGLVNDGTHIFGRVLEAVNSSSMDWRILQSDGSTNGTVDIAQYGNLGGMTPFNGKIYYAGNDTVINASYSIPGLYAFTAITTGINEEQAEINVSLYPNPVNDQLYLNSNEILKGELTLADVTGRVLVNERKVLQTGQNKMDVSQLQPGCYLLAFRSGDRSHAGKFIKQ